MSALEKSYEHIARSMYKRWEIALIRFRRPLPWADLGEPERNAWIAAAKVAYKEITEEH